MAGKQSERVLSALTCLLPTLPCVACPPCAALAFSTTSPAAATAAAGSYSRRLAQATPPVPPPATPPPAPPPGTPPATPGTPATTVPGSAAALNPVGGPQRVQEVRRGPFPYQNRVIRAGVSPISG